MTDVIRDRVAEMPCEYVGKLRGDFAHARAAPVAATRAAGLGEGDN